MIPTTITFRQIRIHRDHLMVNSRLFGEGHGYLARTRFE
jgi:hypothetical protein